LKIAILEFVCSSGLFQADGTDSAGMALLEEGAAMLVALCNDLTSCGYLVSTSIERTIAEELRRRQVEVKSHRLLDCGPSDCGPSEGGLAMGGLAERRATGSRVEEDGILLAVGERQSEIQQLERIVNRWREQFEDCDAVILIAPEIDRILCRLLSRLRSFGMNVFAPDQRFLDCATDKWETAQAWARHSLLTIPTWLATHWYQAFQLGHIQSGSFAVPSDGWVIKRRFGAGAVDMLRFRHADDVAAHIESHLQGCDSSREAFIVQPWVCGQPSSLAIVVSEGRPMRLVGSMDQLFGRDGSYVGGVGPLDLSSDRLERFATELLQAIPGVVNGWIGIDFMRTSSDDWYPLEINARLTSSYLGYRQGYGPGLADAILGASLPLGNSLFPGSIRFSVTEFRG